MDALTSDIHRIEVAHGVRLAVKVSGTEGKPALVFSNSLAADMSTWDEVAERLAPHAHIVRYDTRGHGRSDVPAGPCTIDRLGQDVLALMDALGLQRATVCGLSLGGLTAMWLAIHARKRMSGLILANTAAHFPPARMWQERAASALEGGVAQFVEPTLDRWFTPAFRKAAPARVAQIGKIIAATPPHGYAASCEVLAATNLLPDLARITCPVRVIVGAHDPSTPPERGQEIADAIPGADIVSLDAAHLSAVEAGTAFADTVSQFLSSVRNA